MKNISISEPCHENWAEFTPTEKGAFCSKCSIDVIDFSQKSPDQIKSIIKDNLDQHLCGRFKKSQLTELNDEYLLWENQSSKTFQSKFVYALLMVFGLTLFSCNTEEEMIQGDVEYHNNYLDNSNDVSNNTFNSEDNIHKKGKIKYTPDEVTSCTEVEDNFVLGDTIVWSDEMVDGEMEFSPEYIEYIDDTISEQSLAIDTNRIIESDPINIENQNNNYSPDAYIPVSNIFSAECYPNPTNNQSTIVVNVKETAAFDIYLYEINGKRINSIYQGELLEGRQSFILDMSNYASGTYLIVINGDMQKETIKISKAQ